MSNTALLVGGTGLVGSYILSTLTTLPTVSRISMFARRAPKVADSPKLRTIIEPDSLKWNGQISTLGEVPSIFFSALGTTPAQAGGSAGRRKVDYDLNLALAKAAKDSGIKVYVLISSANPNSKSRSEYSRMKGELEEAIEGLKFEHTVFINPGLIVGAREDSRPAEATMRGIAKFVGMISGGALTNGWSQDAEVIARAAVSAGMKCLEQQAQVGEVRRVRQAEIIRLGQTEWQK
ncbi:hypothetical protein F5884DRAFT_443703 [Xylogone sp. PMI_703]|nr:hypothetical protein F5884DRAFT_443703 [Xylogone sp. PMI_703]